MTTIAGMPPVTEAEIRRFVRSREAESGARLVDEFVVGERGRIDLLSIDDYLRGFEIKSDLDTLYRLPRQMEVFGSVFDYCTLIVTPRHLSAAREKLIRGWGLAVVERASSDELVYKQIRKPKPNKGADPLVMASLLWRDEALHALDRLGAASGLRSRPRDVLWSRLVQVTNQDELREIVTSALTERRGWRDVSAQRGSAEPRQPAGGSSRFLARRLRSPQR